MDNLPERSLINDIFKILDSRIQYMDFQLNKLSKQSLLLEKRTALYQSDNLCAIELIFKQIEQHNRSLKLLLLFRNRLNELNAPVIFRLLTDNKYLDLEKSQLIDELGGENAPEGIMQQQAK